MIVAGVWFITTQSRWFARRLNLSTRRFGLAVGATLRATLYLVAIVTPIVAL